MIASTLVALALMGAANADVRHIRSTESSMVLGYYTNWAQYRSSPGKFYPENVDATILTHVAYGFAMLEDSTYKVVPFEWNDVLDYGDGGMYKRFNDHVKSTNTAAKTTLSLGGWNFSVDYHIFNDMAATAAGREAFATDVIEFVRLHNFDGIDMDWEYPKAADKDNFTQMLKVLREKIDAEAASTGNDPLLLSIAVSANHNTFTAGYDAAAVGDLVDWVGLMSYDLYGSWDSTTRSHTQLYPIDASNATEMAVDRSVSGWLTYIPASKLVMGMATYGRAFTLADANVNTGYACNMLASAVTPAPAGATTGEQGFLAYYEILSLISDGATVCEDTALTQATVVQKGTTWVGYDSVAALATKTAYVKSKGLKGVMFWALDLDDFSNGYPLISSVSSALGVTSGGAGVVTSAVIESKTTTTTTAAAVTTSTEAAATTSSSSDGSSSGCKSLVANISDEWCAAVGCASSYPSICAAV